MIVHKNALILKEILRKDRIDYTSMLQFTEKEDCILVEATDNFLLAQLFLPKAPADIRNMFTQKTEEKQRILISRESCEDINRLISGKQPIDYFSIFEKEKVEVHTLNTHLTLGHIHDVLPDFEAVFPKGKEAFIPYSLMVKLLMKLCRIADKLKMKRIKFEPYGGKHPIKFTAENDGMKLRGLFMPLIERLIYAFKRK